MSAAYKDMHEINNPLSVLVTGAGSVYGMGIIRALKASVLPLEIIAIDVNPYSLGLFFADKSFIAPRAAAEESYYMFIENLCKDHQIKAIFIGSTAELSFYAKNSESWGINFAYTDIWCFASEHGLPENACFSSTTREA